MGHYLLFGWYLLLWPMATKTEAEEIRAINQSMNLDVFWGCIRRILLRTDASQLSCGWEGLNEWDSVCQKGFKSLCSPANVFQICCAVWPKSGQGVEYPVDCIGWPSMILGWGGGLCGCANGEDETGFNNETWNVGLILSERGRNKRKDTGLTFLAIRNGPMYFWESFLDSTRRGRLLVANQTLWPARKSGAIRRRRLAWCWYLSEVWRRARLTFLQVWWQRWTKRRAEGM